MKQRHRKHLVDARQAARLAHRFDREALMQRGMRSSLSWLAEERRRNNWRKKKRAYRKALKFFGGDKWIEAPLRAMAHRVLPTTINMIPHRLATKAQVDALIARDLAGGCGLIVIDSAVLAR